MVVRNIPKRRWSPPNPDREIPGWLRGAFIAGSLVALVVLEHRSGLRKGVHEPKVRRDVRNLCIAAGAGLVMQFVERPLTQSLARRVHRYQWGIVPRFASSSFTQTVLGVLLLDYGLYIWHVLTHKVAFLWRFHLVHHIDLDLDASTALRFHFGEMLLSVPWRLAQIAVIGVSLRALSIWQTLLFASILFHHSNIGLPRRVERLLSFLIMTPRLHGVHHEADEKRANANWSSGLAIWDLLHATYLWDETDGDETHGNGQHAPIGVPAYQSVNDVTLRPCLRVPFVSQRQDWAVVSE